jgi:hypothetical protein
MAKIGTIEIDASVAKKSINDLQKEIREAKKALNELAVGSEGFKAQAQAVQGLEENLKNVNAQLKTQQSRYDLLQKGVLGTFQSIAGGAQSAIAVMNMLGSENEDVLKSLQKMQNLMAFTSGLNSFKQLSSQMQNIYKSITLTNSALSKTKIAIASTGIGALILLLASLYTNWDKVSVAIDDFCTKTLGNSWQKVKDFFSNFDAVVAEWKGAVIGAVQGVGSVVINMGSVIATAINPKNWFTSDGNDAIKSALVEVQNSFNDFSNGVQKAKEEAVQSHTDKKALSATKEAIKELEELYKRDEVSYTSYLNRKTALLQKQALQEKTINKQTSTETLQALKQAQAEREKHNSDVINSNLEVLKILKESQLSNIEDEKQRATQSIQINVWYWQQKIKQYEEGSKEFLELQRSINEAERELMKEQSSMLLQQSQPQAIDTSALLQNMQTSGATDETQNDMASLEYKRQTISEMLYETQTQLLLLNDICENSTTLALESIANSTALYGDSILSVFEKVSNGIEVTTDDVINAITSSIAIAGSATSEILGQLADEQDETSKEGFEKAKKLQIAQATIQMLTGIATAVSGAFTTKSGPWDIILAGVQAAAIATSGALTIAKIKKQKYDGGSTSLDTSLTSSASSATSTISVSDYEGIENSNYMTEQMGNIKVYVTETDITETQNKVSVTEQNNTY